MPKYSSKKKLLYSIIILVLFVIVAEVGLHVLFAISNRQFFSISSANDLIARITEPEVSIDIEEAATAGEMDWSVNDGVEVIHPYLGFVRDPKTSPSTSSIGFLQRSENEDPFNKSDEDTLSIAVFGGSFAMGVVVFADSTIISAFEKRGIKARVVNAAMGGYKQPQQLAALSYLLSHGADIDVVVNLDGFNEVALPQAENIPRGVNPFYPRLWYTRTVGLRDQETLRQIGRVVTLEDERRRWAKKMSQFPRFSIIRNLVWQVGDQGLQRKITETNEALRQEKAQVDQRFMTLGPESGIDGDAQLYEEIADHWVNCSAMMKALCDARGITYLHALQPNQYFQTDRTFTEDERKVAIREDHAYRPGVEQGYSRLLEAGTELQKQGVSFHDLTEIFDDISQPIYVDDCCHTNAEGYEIIANYLAESIADSLGKNSSQ